MKKIRKRASDILSRSYAGLLTIIVINTLLFNIPNLLEKVLLNYNFILKDYIISVIIRLPFSSLMLLTTYNYIYKAMKHKMMLRDAFDEFWAVKQGKYYVVMFYVWIISSITYLIYLPFVAKLDNKLVLMEDILKITPTNNYILFGYILVMVISFGLTYVNNFIYKEDGISIRGGIGIVVNSFKKSFKYWKITLSFILWSILYLLISLFSFGIGLFYFIPYIMILKILVFEEINKEKEESFD